MDRDRSGKEDSGWPDPGCSSWNCSSGATGITILGDVFVSALKGNRTVTGVFPCYQFSV